METGIEHAKSYCRFEHMQLVIVETERAQIEAIDGQYEAKHEKVAMIVKANAVVEPS